MKLDFCAVCGTIKDLHQHHIEPVVFTGISRTKKKKFNPKKSLGRCDVYVCFARIFDMGYISEDGDLTLCSYHHNIMHGIIRFHKLEHSNLIKEGIKNAKKRGVVLGRPGNLTPEVKDKILEMRSKNVGINKISKACGVGAGTIYKVINDG